jgi:long-chain acyl-CoA synthetase
MEFIINQTEMSVLIASPEKLKLILKLIGKLPTLKKIITMDRIEDDDLRNKTQEAGIELFSFEEIEAKGATSKVDPTPPSPLDLCTICYTSGTTGKPKGVMLPHRAILSDASACLTLVGFGDRAASERQLFKLDASDVHLSYLPLAHIFERVVFTALSALGASAGFYQGDTLKIIDDVAALQPTLFVSVPRLLNKIYEKVMQSVETTGGISKMLFNFAYQSKVENLHNYGELNHWFWDRLVFKKIQARLGGRVRAILSGAAPLAPEVMDFLRVCFACEVYEGYGQTETSAGTSLTVVGDWTTGHIGVPTPANEVKLVDDPEMNYTSLDSPYPRGEICVRGLNCFTGYYKDEEKTRETIDEEGWIHSGDIGSWDSRGRLVIIDRKKNIFKLSGRVRGTRKDRGAPSQKLLYPSGVCLWQFYQIVLCCRDCSLQGAALRLGQGTQHPVRVVRRAVPGPQGQRQDPQGNHQIPEQRPQGI